MSDTFYVTTPIYYVNDVPHIGHAYTTIAADCLARWHRLAGESVYFMTGTDEHGQKIEQAAEKAGVSPQAQADRISAPFKRLFELMGITHDDFIRTTEDRHCRVVQAIWRRMVAAGDIYQSVYEGWYSVGDEAYFTEEELVEGRSPTGHEVKWMQEPSFFFRLSKYGDWLLEHMEAHPEFIRPQSRFNEVKRFVESGLRDISVSRTNFTWGVAVPGEPGHVIYVWLDALTNYISALGGPEGALYERFWPNVVHLIGKDILRFHAVWWPCFLHAAGLEPPRQIFAHGWWTSEGKKMSKTLGNVVDPEAMIRTFGNDPFRYFLLREVSFGLDGDFSLKAFTDRLNGDLANDLGNLASRALSMVGRYRAGVVPARGQALPELDNPLRAIFHGARAELLEAMELIAFHRALGAIWRLVREANRYVDACAPWHLDRDGDTRRLDEVLYNLCEVLRVIGTWCLPFLPEKAAELLDRLSLPAGLRSLAATEAWGQLPSGLETRVGEALFPRLDRKKTKKKQRSGPKKAKPAPSQAETIEYGDFAKLQLRVAKVLAAEKHPNADRLLVITLDAGDPEPRTVCAGIAGAYAPEALVGKTVVLLANLAPRKLRGVLSEGMLLAAGDDQSVRLLSVEGETPAGTAVS